MVDELSAISAETGYEPTQLVLAWGLSRPAVTSVIVGSSRPEQIVKNAEAAAVELPEDVLRRLDAL
jgi:aryl-alcohol dehydrogenase-like predicted oxidoreductase